MVSINVNSKTKQRFKIKKLKESAKQGEDLSENDFVNILLNSYEEEKE